MPLSNNILKFIFCLLCLGLFHASAQQYAFTNFNNKEIIPSSFVYKTFEDSKGYVWFLTDHAITRYDGHHAKLFGAEDGYNEGGAYHITEDKTGRIWVITVNFKLYYYEADRFHRVNTFFGEVGWFYVGADNTKWVLTKTKQGLYKIDDKNHLSKPIYRYKSYHRFHSFIPLNDSSYLFSFTHNVCYFSNGKIKPLLPSNTYTNFVISRFFQINNSVYAATYQGIYEFVKGTMILRYPLSNNQVFDLFIENSRIWVACEKGLFLLTAGSPGQWQLKTHFLKGHSIHSITRNKDHLLWLSTASQGVYTFNPETEYYNTSNRFTDIPVTHVKADQQTVYAFTKTSNYYTLKDRHLSTKQLPLSPDGHIVKVQFSRNLSDSEILAYANKSFILEKGRIRFCNNKPGVICAKLGSYGEGRLMVDSLINLINEKRTLLYKDEWINLFDTYSKKGIVLHDASPLLHIKDTLYYHTDKGLLKVHRVKGCMVHRFIPFKGIIWMAIYEQGVIYLTTKSNGLYLLNNNQVTNITTANGLLSNNCSSLLASHGYVWIATNKGISRLNIKTGTIRNFTGRDYLADEQVNDLALFRDTVFVATNSGILAFPEHRALAEQVPDIYLEKLLLNNSIDLIADSIIKTDYLNNNFTLQLVSPGYRSGKSNRFRLIITKENVIDTFYYDNSSIQLLALMPGSYHIRADVMNIDGIWSKKPVSFDILIHPPFWKTLWFISLVIVFICSGVGYVIWISVKRQRDVQEYNRKIVESELKSLRLYMNPHFLFNSLTSLQSFILTVRTDEANYFITKFSKLIRAVMNYSVKGELLLKEEIQLLNSYIELESVRFGSEFTYTVTYEDGLDIDNIMIPSLLIQPFVENAIKHGVTGVSDHCYIKVWFEMRGTNLYCIVTDNGKGRNKRVSEETTHISSGIKFTEERIKLLINKKEEVITISDHDPLNTTMPGTRVEIHVPILNDQTDD